MIHSNLENTTGARGNPHIFFVIYYPIKLKDPDGKWTEKMKIAVQAAIDLGKKYSANWNCDIFVEYIIESTDVELPTTWNNALNTTVNAHLSDMKNEIKNAPENGTNIVFHGGNHAMLLSLNDDGSVDTTHLSSTNKDSKATEVHWDSLASFESHWKKQGNGELKYVPLYDNKARRIEIESFPVPDNSKLGVCCE